SDLQYDTTTGQFSTTFDFFEPGQTRLLILDVAAKSGTNGQKITLTATGTVSGVTDSNPANNTVSQDITVTGAAHSPVDLSVALNAFPSSQTEDGQVEFIADVINSTSSNATNVHLHFALPAGLTYVSADIPPGTTFDSATGNWVLPTLSNSTEATLEIIASV